MHESLKNKPRKDGEQPRRTVVKKQIQLTPSRTKEGGVKDPWWTYEDRELAESVFQVANKIDGNQRSLWRANIGWAQLYENLDTLGYMPNFFAPIFGTVPPTSAVGNRLTYNVVKSCVDSVVAKISKNKPRAKFTTNGASYVQQQRAQKLTEYVDGLFYASDAYKHGQRAFKDACVFGTGFIKTFREPGSTRLLVERVLPTEIVVDQADGVYATPSCLFQRKNANRDALLEAFPERADDINACASLPHTVLSSADQVQLIEAWRLPMGDNPGKHAVCIENAALFEEDWDHDFFPFVRIVWTEKLAGYFGMGLCEELAGIQLAINKNLKVIQAAQEYLCVPRVFVEAGSVIAKKAAWDAGIMEYAAGTNPPVYNMNDGPPQALYAWLETLFNKAYLVSGVSQLQASAQKPAGLNSGVALREYQDISTERFAIQGQRWETAFLELAKIMIELTKEMVRDGEMPAVTVDSRYGLVEIKWNEVELSEDNYIMKVWPVSQLPETPEGKLQAVQEYAQAGLIDQDNLFELLDIPDIKGFLNAKTASYKSTLRILDTMVNDGTYIPPQPYQNLKQCRDMAQARYLELMSTDIDDDALQLLRHYMDDIDALLQPAAVPVSATPTPQLGSPAAPPMAEMLPNAPVAAAPR